MRYLTRSVFASTLLLAVSVTGCVSGAEDGTDSDAAAGDADVAASEPLTGSIRGRVVDDELRPISNASVALLEAELSQKTAADGSFRFHDVPPGDYTLAVQKVEYESQATDITVAAGEPAEVTITLLAAVVAYHETTLFNGYLECALALVAIAACSWPYTAVYGGAQQNGINLSNYGLPPDIQNNRYRYNFTVDPGHTAIISELVWDATSEGARRLYYWHSCADYDPVVDDCLPHYTGQSGESPIYMEAWKAPDEPKQQWVMANIYPPSDSYVAGVHVEPWGFNFFLDQRFEAFNTVFYGEEPPVGWSVLPS